MTKEVEMYLKKRFQKKPFSPEYYWENEEVRNVVNGRYDGHILYTEDGLMYGHGAEMSGRIVGGAGGGSYTELPSNTIVRLEDGRIILGIAVLPLGYERNGRIGSYRYGLEGAVLVDHSLLDGDTVVELSPNALSNKGGTRVRWESLA